MKQKNVTTDGRTLAALNAAGRSYGDLAKEYGITRGKVAGLIHRYKLSDVSVDDGETSFEQGNDFINIVCASKRLMSQEDLIKHFHVDTNLWEVVSYKIKTSEGYRKDRRVQWEVSDGVVTHGSVNDTGKMLVVPLYHIELRMRKKVHVSRAKDAIEILIEDAKKHAPKYQKLAYKIQPGNKLLYEIAMPDLHFGRLSWAEESGEDYDIKLARKAVESVISQLLTYAENYQIGKILIPLGNDFFNSDNKENATTRGTSQDEDTRWQKTFRRGRELAVSIIDACAVVAPVDVIIIPGNHDEQRSFYLGDALDCWYHNDPNTTIDNSARKRKYYQYGVSLIGFTHGYSEKLTNLPLVMATEVPELWARSKYREWHTGDKHHKADLVPGAKECSGVVVRILRSLAPADAWTFDKGFIGALRAAESFVWDAERGLIAQISAAPLV